MPIPSETIALPIVKGLDVQTDARLVQAPALLEAENTQFSGGGAKKRRGHTSLRVRTEDQVIPEYTEGGILAPGALFPDWYYGLGYGSDIRGTGEEDERYWTFPQPEVKKLYGVASRDNETVVWDGFRLLSYLPSQLNSQAPMAAEVDGQATLPSLRATPFAKFNQVQTQPEFADNGTTKLFAWLSDGGVIFGEGGGGGGSSVNYAIYDSVSDALIAKGTLAVTTGDYIRCFTLGTWMHIAVRDNDDDKVKLFSISSESPNSITYRSYGDADHFDIWKVSDEEALLARTNAEGIDVAWISTVGAGSPSRTHFHFDPTVTSGVQTLVSIGYTNNQIGLVWYNGTSAIGYALFGLTGVVQREESIPATSVVRLTLSPKLAQVTVGHPAWDIYWDDNTNLYTQRFWRIGVDETMDSVGEGTKRTRYRMRLASRAWRVGDRTFVWAGHPSTLQSTWFLLDEGLLPVGKLNFAVADVSGLGTNGRLAGINFKDGEDYDSLTPNFHLALCYKLRVAPNDSQQATVGIYTEPTPQAVELNFLPKLQTAQAGRALYIAGAQLWTYDGQEIVEAGFHTGPEPTLTPSALGGALDVDGTYSYRVDLCYRNAQNEEVRSLSILTDSLEMSSTYNKITLTIPTVLTRRTNSYFLIYRNAMSNGVPLVNWWLLNSRDPSSPSFLANDLEEDTLTYVDDGAVNDTDIQTREFHPASDSYVQPISAPACEIITAGRDRLWVAGGELPPGKVAPSRLFDAGECPAFNAYLEFQVDRSSERVTAMGFLGDVGVFFRRNSTYLLDSDGPDNNAQGFWNPVRLALADVGAVSQDSVVRTSAGLVFQSPAGFRMVGPGGALSAVGVEIDSAARDFDVVGSFLVERDQEARFYGSDGTYTFNYLQGTWSHWSCSGVGVAKGPNGFALLAREDGELWIEDEVYTDAGTPYVHRIRTSWLHGGNVGDFQRVRRIGGLGRFASLDTPSHLLRLEIFYDEREFWEERVEWEMPDSTVNGDTWGAADWGDGVWGDTTATVNNLEDLTWEWVRRPSRQKCSVFSVALEDVNTDGPGFILSAFTFELARKQGLNRTPERTGTGTTR